MPFDEVRTRLKALGYLESPVERYLSQPAGGPWRTGITITARLSLLLGLLLAGINTASTLLVDPAFIRNTADVALLILYLGGIYSLTMFGLLLIPAVCWIRRGSSSGGLVDGGTLRATLLGVSATVALCIYLLGWWHVMSLESALVRPLGLISLAVLLAIGLISLAAGRLMGFVYYLLAGVPEHPRRISRQPLSRRMMASLALVLLIEGAWAAGTFRYYHADHSLSGVLKNYSLRPLPMLLVGLDGLDGRALDRLAGLGKLPNLKRLMDEGFQGELEPERDSPAPQLWTTIATGVRAEYHGIDSYIMPVLRGLSREPRLGVGRPGLQLVLEQFFPFFQLSRQVPVSGGARLTRTIWEVVELFGVPAGVVNWWASWPAGPALGFTVSERSYPKLALLQEDRTVKPSVYFENEVSPPAEFDSLAALCQALTEPFDHLLLDFPVLGELLRRESLPLEARQLVRSVLFADFFYASAALELARRREPGLLALYLQGADILGRLEERSDLVRPRELDGVLPEYYRFLDYLLGQLLESYQPNGLTVVVCDPGHRGRLQGLTGAALFAGLDVNPRSRASVRLLPEDIAPTMLYLMGLPVARNMTGHPLVEAGAPGPGGATPLSYVSSYGPPPAAQALILPYHHDRQLLERLRSLGYVK